MNSHNAFQLFMFVKVMKLVIIFVYLWQLTKHCKTAKYPQLTYLWMGIIALILFFDAASIPVMWDDLLHSG